MPREDRDAPRPRLVDYNHRRIARLGAHVRRDRADGDTRRADEHKGIRSIKALAREGIEPAASLAEPALVRAVLSLQDIAGA